MLRVCILCVGSVARVALPGASAHSPALERMQAWPYQALEGAAFLLLSSTPCASGLASPASAAAGCTVGASRESSFQMCCRLVCQGRAMLAGQAHTIGVPACISVLLNSVLLNSVVRGAAGLPRRVVTKALVNATLAATSLAAQALASARMPLTCTTLALLHKLSCVVRVRISNCVSRTV